MGTAEVRIRRLYEGTVAEFLSYKIPICTNNSTTFQNKNPVRPEYAGTKLLMKLPPYDGWV
jgi:hypothetical protein